MTTSEKKWSKIGSSKTSPTTDTKRKEVVVENTYGVTIGFEVNKPHAFIDDIQNLDIDYGHAFFYLTENDKVTNFFSFGPDGPGVEGKITDEYSGERPGTAEYKISEAVKLFRLKLSKGQAESIHIETEKVKGEIKSGKQKYTAYLNDTCAETARDILKKTIRKIPDGSGEVIMGGKSSYFSVVNPYMWHRNFKFKYFEYSLPSIGGVESQRLRKNDSDPLSGSLFEEIK